MSQPNPLYQYVPVNTTYVPAQEVQRHRVQTSYDPRRVPTFVEDTVEFSQNSGCPVHGAKRYNDARAAPTYAAAAAAPAYVAATAAPTYVEAAPTYVEAAPTYAAPESAGSGAFAPSATPAPVAAGYPVASTTVYPATTYSEASGAQPEYQAVPMMTGGATALARGSSATRSYLLTYPRGDEADAVQYRGMVNAGSASTSEGYTTLSALPARGHATKRACC